MPLRSIIFACFCSLIAATQSAYSETKPISLFANPTVPVDTLTPSQLRLIFAGRTQFWPNGTRIRVFILQPESAIHKQFCANVLNLFPYQLERIWQRITYSGQGNAPTVITSHEALLVALSNAPGAIGYSQEPLHETLKVKLIPLEVKQ